MPDETKKIKATLDFDLVTDLRILKLIALDFGFWGENHNTAVDLLGDIDYENKGEDLIRFIRDEWPYAVFEDSDTDYITVSDLLLFLEINEDEIRKTLNSGELK